MRAGWIVLAVAVAVLSLGAVVVSQAGGPVPSGASTDPDALAPAAHREGSAAARRAPATAPSTTPAAASRPAAAMTGPAAAPAVSPVVTALAPHAPASAPPDARVPPIDPPASNEAEHAQPWEVADPALYRAREQRLQREVDTRFVQAAAARLPQLRAAVDQMRARGASADDIARAEDKISHMQAVQDALLRGEPLAAAAPIEAPASHP